MKDTTNNWHQVRRLASIPCLLLLLYFAGPEWILYMIVGTFLGGFFYAMFK